MCMCVCITYIAYTYIISIYTIYIYNKIFVLFLWRTLTNRPGMFNYKKFICLKSSKHHLFFEKSPRILFCFLKNTLNLIRNKSNLCI